MKKKKEVEDDRFPRSNATCCNVSATVNSRLLKCIYC